MLPYHVQQLKFALIALVPVLVFWLALRKHTSGPWRLIIETSILTAVTELLVVFCMDGHIGFRAISFVFWGNCVFIPFLGLITGIRHTRRRRVSGTSLAVTSLAALSVVAFAMFVEPNRLETRHEVIVHGDWQAERPLRIAHVSDLQTVGFTNREAVALERINAWQPDFVVFTGDYIAGPFTDCDEAIAAARRFLSGLSPKIAVIVVDGHSEPDHRRAEVFSELNLVHLRNETREYKLSEERILRITGLDVHAPRISMTSHSGDSRVFNLVASHVPDVTRDLVGQGIDLHLAGHTHGGQIVIPGFGAPITLSELPREYARGLKLYDDHLLNVCAGLGMEGDHAPRVRLFSPPEIVFIEIRGREKPQ